MKNPPRSMTPMANATCCECDKTITTGQYFYLLHAGCLAPVANDFNPTNAASIANNATEPIKVVHYNDPINRPVHYTMGRIEVINFIEDQEFGYHLGNAIKYICRARYKGEYEKDLEKAIWYINRAKEKKS